MYFLPVQRMSGPSDMADVLYIVIVSAVEQLLPKGFMLIVCMLYAALKNSKREREREKNEDNER